MTCQLGNRCPDLFLVLISVLALLLLTTSSPIHTSLDSLETGAAIAANSLVGIYPTFDHILGWLNTRAGDALILSVMAIVFIAHSFRASTFAQLVERLSFWWWVATLCIATYVLICLTEDLYPHPIPLQALPSLHDVRSIYAIPVHTSAFNSYPSGHGLAYIFFALMAWYKRYSRMSLFILVAGTIMLSTRVVLGLHWLSDILLGALPLSLVLCSAALGTALKNSYYPFHSITYFVLARLSGHAWIFERLAASEYRQSFRITSWTDAIHDDLPSSSKGRELEPSIAGGRQSSSTSSRYL